MRRFFEWTLVISLMFSSQGMAWADEVSKDELKAMRHTLEELKQVIQKQQTRIEELERKVNAPRPTAPAGPRAVPALSSAPGAPTRPVAPARTQAAPGQIGAVLPEIGVVGDIVATSTQKRTDTEGNDRIALREMELVLGNYVDPYCRYDATISFSDSETPSVEEGYLTYWGLPWGVKGRFGRFFPRIGKAASMHRDSLSTVDDPLVVRRFFNDDGFKRTGVDFTRPFEGPFGWVLEPSAGLLEGGGASVFGSTRRRPTLYSHLKAFRSLSDFSNLELGVSGLLGSKDADSGFEVGVLGVDTTYLHHVTPTNKLTLQSEVYVQDRKESLPFDAHPWGAYALADYRFAPRWSAGGRLDQVRLIDAVGSRHEEQGLSTFLTFYQSEFARWRLQFRHEIDQNKKHDNAVFLQGTFAIGTHKHSLQ